ncbi:MAG: hypothetical protein ACFFA0_12275 [Promethearchaeota archaeon]
MKIESEAEFDEYNGKGHVKIDWGRQGGVLLGYITVLLGYYGIIANVMMVDEFGDWIPFVDMDKTILFWSYTTYMKTFFTPALLLFAVCFLLTYKEDIPQYGIKATIWLIPCIIAEGHILYSIMFGFDNEAISLRLGSLEGYLDIIIIFSVAILGAISGMKFKEFIVKRKVV